MITYVPAHSNNYGKGRVGKPVEFIILHWIVGTLEASDAAFQNPKRRASAHYGIGDDEIHQYLDEADTAWHCGNLDINQRSIGIEHEGSPAIVITSETYKTSGWLVAQIARRYNIPLDRTHIKGHKEISPTQCPGTLDIDRVITEAKKYLASQEVTPMDYSKKQAIIDTYKGLTGEYPSDDEVKFRLDSQKNMVEIIEDICGGDGRFYERWIKPKLNDPARVAEDANQVSLISGLLDQVKGLLGRWGKN